MANERANWLVLPSHMIRAARHYEGAAQILIRHAVMSARNVRLQLMQVQLEAQFRYVFNC